MCSLSRLVLRQVKSEEGDDHICLLLLFSFAISFLIFYLLSFVFCLFLLMYIQLILGLNFHSSNNASLAISELQAISKRFDWSTIHALEVCTY